MRLPFVTGLAVAVMLSASHTLAAKTFETFWKKVSPKLSEGVAYVDSHEGDVLKADKTFLEIINNTNIAEEQKQEAIDGMIELTDVAEKETAAEILLEAKGFEDVVVSITDDMVDVVVNTAELTEAQRAQIEDIVVRKTGMNPEAIVISTLAQQ